MSLDLVVLGNLLVDDVVLANGETRMGLPGGGGSSGTASRVRFEIRVEEDLLSAGRRIWELCEAAGFSSMEAMQIRTAFSELARNILKFAGEGEVILNRLGEEGVRLIFLDEGPGMPDVEQAMGYGFSTAKSLGLGLPGSKKLADKFEVHSEPVKGTRIVSS